VAGSVPDPDPDLLAKGTDPDPNPDHSIIKQKYLKKFDFYSFVTSL
jgi:hypothetical protein